MSNKVSSTSRNLREQRFRATADEIIRSNRKIRDHIRSVKNFYLGDTNAPVPPIENRLETILNPKCNGACPCFEHLTTAAKEYRTGEKRNRILRPQEPCSCNLVQYDTDFLN